VVVAAWILATVVVGVVPPDEPRKPPVGLALTWQAPDECGDHRSFLLGLARLSGRELVLDPHADVRIAITITMVSTGYVLHVHTEELELDDRELSAPSCPEVVDAASLVVLTRLATLREPIVPGPPMPSGLGVPAADRAPDERGLDDHSLDELTGDSSTHIGLRSTRARRPLQIVIGIAAGPAFHVGPGWTGTMRLHLGLGTETFRGELFGARGFAKDAGEVEGTSPAIRLTALGIRACGVPRMRVSKIAIPLCAGAALGIASATPDEALDESRRGRQAWGSASVEAGLMWAFHPRVALRMNAALVGVWRRPRFYIEDDVRTITVYRASALGGLFEVGVEVRFLAKTREQGGA